MPNDIGSVTSINGHSTALNCQPGQGTVKPSAKGDASPGGTKPMMAPEASVPMPK